MKADRTLRTIAVGVAIAAGVVVFIAAVLIVLGTGGAAAQDDPPQVTRVTVNMFFQEHDEVLVPRIVDELAPETLLTIEARGFDDDTTGEIRQCVLGATRRCRNLMRVRFDDGGAATFQYLVTDDVGGSEESGRCRLAGDRCTIELTDGRRTMALDTVFVDEAPPPGQLTVSPTGNLLIGDTVTVIASGFPPQATLTATICVAPSTRGSRCGAPAPQIPVTIGSDGTATAEMTLDIAEVGKDGVACGRRSRCHVVVIGDEVGIRARPATLSFADAPGADYDRARVALGLAAAAALAALAAWLFRSTDWNPPPEADSSAIDDADYADLDLEAELFGDPTPVSTH